MRPAGQLIFPGGVLLLAVAALQPWFRVPASVWPMLRVYSFVILAGGLLIAWGFRRGRVACGLLTLALAGEVLRRLPAGQITPLGADQALPYDLIAFLLPLNLAFFACGVERSPLTPRGITRLALILAQAGAGAWIYAFQWSPVAGAVSHAFIHPPWIMLTPLRQPALLAFAGALTALLIKFYRQPRPVEAGFITALVGAFLALHLPAYVTRLPVATLFIAATQTALVLGVLMASHAMAYLDELTGIPSRRAMNELLPQLGRRYAIAMVDVDHFKKFNDRYGHDAGDQVLRMVAAKLARLPAGGKVFRYGGEEFTIIFPGRSIDESVDHLEHIRKSIEQGGFAVRGKERPRQVKDTQQLRGRPASRPATHVRVTVSMGVAESGARLADPPAVIRAADKALYRAKKAGRNQLSE